PNIVQITDLGRAGDEYFIAMEYIEGSDLERLLASARIRGAQVPVRVAFTIVRRLCAGLHAAHVATSSEGRPLALVQRDVKTATGHGLTGSDRRVAQGVAAEIAAMTARPRRPRRPRRTTRSRPRPRPREVGSVQVFEDGADLARVAAVRGEVEVAAVGGAGLV